MNQDDATLSLYGSALHSLGHVRKVQKDFQD